MAVAHCLMKAALVSMQASAAVPLRELLDPALLTWVEGVAAASHSGAAEVRSSAVRAKAATGRAQEPAVPEPRPPQRPAVSSLESGQLDMSAFGLPSASEEAPPQRVHSQLESGQLDMSAFGLPSAAETAPVRPAQSQMESGMLNMSAFGMSMPHLEPPAQQTDSQLHSGQLDMSAFGLPTIEPQQPSHSQLDSGQLDLSAFGMSLPAVDAPQQQAASPLETGQVDMSAFGLSSAAEPEPPKPAHSQLESGQLDLSAFGMGFAAPEAPTRPSHSSQLESGQLDMSAFGLASDSDDKPAQPSSGLRGTSRPDTYAHGFGLPSPELNSTVPGESAPAASEEPPLTAAELSQLRSLLGLRSDLPASPMALGKPSASASLSVGPNAQHTAASFFAATSAIDGDDDGAVEDQDGTRGDQGSGGEAPVSAPALSAAETVHALAIAQLLLPEGAVKRSVSGMSWLQ